MFPTPVAPTPPLNPGGPGLQPQAGWLHVLQEFLRTTRRASGSSSVARACPRLRSGGLAGSSQKLPQAAALLAVSSFSALGEAFLFVPDCTERMSLKIQKTLSITLHCPTSPGSGGKQIGQMWGWGAWATEIRGKLEKQFKVENMVGKVA